jgi:hypothetical protein
MAAAALGSVRLSEKTEQYLASTLDALRKSGASEEELNSSKPGLTGALFVEYRAFAWGRVIFPILDACISLMIVGPALISWIVPLNWKYWHFWKGFDILGIIYFWLSLTLIFGMLKVIVIDFFNQRENTILARLGFRDRSAHVITFIVSCCMLFIVLVFGSYELYQGYRTETSVWDFVVLILCGAWVFSLLNIFVRLRTYISQRALAFIRPDCALITSLCSAFRATRNEAAWHDQTHRNRIARDLTVAADAIEKFMPRHIATQSAPSSISVVRQRLKETAIPLRDQIAWLVTPGPLTRTDLEAELRKAIIATSRGELARLEGASDPTRTAQVSGRNWWGLAAELSRGIAWALTPLALVQIGSALQLPLLSRPEEQTTAQKAAYIWLALAILRGLSRGNFKETIETAGSLMGRSKPTE